MLHPEVHDYIRGSFGKFSHRVGRSRFYSGMVDLRPIGRDAMLHLNCKFGDHKHKLEILDAGDKSYSDLLATHESIVVADPSQFGIIRIDLAADLPDVPVSWFQQHARVKHKRFATEHGELKYERFGRGKVETIGAGKRPNHLRIYDKVAEYEVQFRRMERKVSADADPLDFEKVFGVSRDSLLTRVERQCGGGRLPKPLQKIGDLHKAAEFNPFEIIEIFDSGAMRLPRVDECATVSEYFKGLGMRQVAMEMGLQDFHVFLNKHTGGKASKQLERYAPFFVTDPDVRITSDYLYQQYRESTIRQLAA